ncbi:MAG: MBL fold metallo-hydrolase [Gemmataceae bacterium]|nr:MBL fold metallo-hydrolase [Gemmataceae bacterium]
MRSRVLLPALCLALVGLAAWVGQSQTAKPESPWKTVFDADGLKVLRSPSSPASYLLQAGDESLLIDAPMPVGALPAKPGKVLLTHHHRDTVAAASTYVDKKIPVMAAQESAEWLKPDLVAKHWEKTIPLRDSRASYFVVPVGVDGIEYSLKQDAEIKLGEWTLTVIPTPGHSRDHVAFSLNKAGRKTGPLVFTGDAVSTICHLWTPFTTDWDHWTDAGLKPTADSVKRIADLKPSHLFPSRGELWAKPGEFLAECERRISEAGRLKSFERFVGDQTQTYDFLVPKEQVGSGGDKPWSRVSPHLWLTGNTYVLTSKEANACLVVDPWGQRAVDQVAKLRKDENLGPIEAVTFSHAHYDHFDGVYTLPVKGDYKVWTLDRVAEPLKEPFKYRAPFLDVRPIAFDKEIKDGDSITWREYTFRFHHFPGQSEFTCAIETTIDGKRCLFTADNFFHVRQYSGSGGWMGLNRSFPSVYAKSADKVLKINPEWILAEHGGPYVFNRKDYVQRTIWGEQAGEICDKLCLSKNHRLDWNPHRVSVEPVLVKAKPGQAVKAKVRVEPGQKLAVTFDGRGVVPDQTLTDSLEFKLPETIAKGRHVFAVHARDASGAEVTDTFFAVDVE